MPFFRAACACFIVTLVPLHCGADILETVTGDRLCCKVLSVKSDRVEVQSPLVGEIEIERKKIALIRFGHHDIKARTAECVETARGDATEMLVEILTHMPPSVAAKAIGAICDRGKPDLVINVLRLMEPRMSAQVIAGLQNPILVAELAQRYSPDSTK